LSEGRSKGEDFILIGKVLKPHGIKGDLRVRYFNPDLSFFLNYRHIYLKDNKRGILRRFEVREVNIREKAIIISLEGIRDRDAAQRWAGSEVLIHRQDLPPLEEDEYYWEDIIGLKVYSVEGEYLGEVVNILPTGSNDVYEVRGPKGEMMLPAVSDVIKQIDLEGGRILVDIPGGLSEE